MPAHGTLYALFRLQWLTWAHHQPRGSHGPGFSGDDADVFRAHARVRSRLRKARRTQVSWLYTLSAAVALGLLIYLIFAMVRAEDL